MASVYTYNVAPRYTPGSPAQVDERTARKVVVEERRGYIIALSGAHGEAERATAMRPFALNGIVEQRLEYTDGWVISDLMTLDVFYRFHHPEKLPTSRQREKAHERIRMQVRYVLLEQFDIVDRIVSRMRDAWRTDDLLSACDASEELEILAKRIAEMRPSRVAADDVEVNASVFDILRRCERAATFIGQKSDR